MDAYFGLALEFGQLKIEIEKQIITDKIYIVDRRDLEWNVSVSRNS